MILTDKTIEYNNSPACSLSAAGAMQYRYEYDAGVPIRLRRSKRSVFNADSHVMPVNAGTNVGFTGQRVEYIDNNGLELGYYKNRWYSPGMGRFISQDPLGIVPGGGENGSSPSMQYMDGLNLYCYVKNAPLNYVDVTDTNALKTLLNLLKYITGKYLSNGEDSVDNAFDPFDPTTLGPEKSKNCWWKDVDPFSLVPKTPSFDFKLVNLDDNETVLDGTPCSCSGCSTLVYECNNIKIRDLNNRNFSEKPDTYCENGHQYRKVSRRISGDCSERLYNCSNGKWKR